VQLLTSKRALLDNISALLLEKEVIDGEEFERLLGSEKSARREVA
jgi:ATP-dependent Zn protease